MRRRSASWSGARPAASGSRSSGRRSASDRLGPRMQARLVAVVDAVDAVRPLAGDWGRLSGAAVPAISITSHLEQHDVTAFEATQEGAAGRYAAALERLTGATAELDAAQVIRDRLPPARGTPPP